MASDKNQTPQEMVNGFMERYPDLMGILKKFFRKQIEHGSFNDIDILIHIISVYATITRIELAKTDRLMNDKAFEDLFHNV